MSISPSVLKGMKKALKIGGGVAAGAAVVGGISAVKSGQKKMKTPKRGTYTSHLRNNVLAGKIGFNELSEGDMRTLKKVGLN